MSETGLRGIQGPTGSPGVAGLGHDPEFHGYVKATVQRHVTDEETVAFEGMYETSLEALSAVTAQLKLCREHMIAHNEQVRLVHETKSTELDAAIEAKGVELKERQSQLLDVEDKLSKAGKRLRSA